jgi:hypothetical protein
MWRQTMTEETGNNDIIKRKLDWKRYITVLLPVFVIILFTIVFSGSSSSSDCGGGDSDCSSSSADLAGACGEPVKVDKSGTVTLLQSLNLKSASTDLRCGFGVSWSYSWKDKTSTKKPPITIAVSAPKGGTSKANSGDTGGGNGWAGTYTVARGNVSGSAPVLGTISVTASAYDPSMLLDKVSVNLHLVYSSVKK